MKPFRSARPDAVLTRIVLERDNYRCYLCGQTGATLADHVLALAKGGKRELSNLRAAHKSCNGTKSGRIDNRSGPVRWLRIPESHPDSAR